MNPAQLKLITIISEPVLKSNLVNLVRSLGASGVTITDVQGEGSSNKNAGEIPDLKTKIEIVASKTLAQKIMTKIAEDFFQDYSLITYSTDIEVIRKEKF